MVSLGFAHGLDPMMGLGLSTRSSALRSPVPPPHPNSLYASIHLPETLHISVALRVTLCASQPLVSGASRHGQVC